MKISKNTKNTINGGFLHQIFTNLFEFFNEMKIKADHIQAGTASVYR